METDNGAAQAPAALSVPRKLELPKLRFKLTKEEIEKDFMMMTGKLPCPKKHPKTVEKKIKLITPGAYLPDVNMGRYTVRIRKSRKDKQRKAGLKGMMEDESSNDSN
ncbi:hypothetical protein BRADI_2g17059v3 [Brachypodium distachyon]|uniref:Uncharacterized protein n=1 Tax=Brachypodium distachyon TaxID=15368 RepID=A0A0Q3MKY8_BRADI|nr:hypothetical protein BRADI_2g17059v3 [Brachypodium distachyon]